jgi:tRNA G10  N-methylase Trm11
MFSFVGDVVLDPFLGTGTSSVAAARSGRNSIGFEVDEHYYQMARSNVGALADLFGTVSLTAEDAGDSPAAAPSERPSLSQSGGR